MIEFVSGDMFEKKADIRINTVNCVGAMGAGVALAFKSKFPVMFKEYYKECQKKTIRPGKPHVWTDYRIDGNVTIINFPTKDNWRDPSEYRYIELGLKWLREFLKEKQEISVTIPALGCGHGGLEWERVKGFIVEYLEGLDARIYVFEPADTHRLNEKVLAETNNELIEQKITIVNPSDSHYPRHFKGKSSAPFYVKGDLSVLDKNALVIISSREMEDREKDAISLCLKYIMDYDIAFIVGYSAGDCFILRKLLNAKRKVIVCLDEGILQFSVKKDLADCWNEELVTVVSILKPKQKWTSYNLKTSMGLKISMGKATLITAYNPTWLTKTHGDIHKLLKNSFVVNYGSFSPAISNFFFNNQIIPVSKDIDGKPKLKDLSDKILH